MKRKLLLSALLLSLSNAASAQDFLGYRQSNYSGVSGGDFNPASIADNRFSVDVTILGMYLAAYNDRMYINPHTMPHWWIKSFNIENTASEKWLTDPNFGEIVPADSADYYTSRGERNFFEFDNPEGKARKAFVNLNIDVFNLMVSINRKYGMAISLGAKVRSLLKVDHLSVPLIDFAQNNPETPERWDQLYEEDLVNMAFNSWAEYNVGFAMNVLNRQQHFVKVGTKLKFLQGLGAFYTYADKLDYEINEADTSFNIKGNINYAYSANIDDYVAADELSLENIYQANSKLGFGIDMGVVYEWRPHWKRYLYDMDGKTNLWRRDKNKYTLKFNFALNDVGGMRYKKSGNSRDLSVNANVLELDDIPFKFESANDYIDTLIAKGQATQNVTEETFYTGLPTHINTGVDWNIWNHFYLQLNSTIGFKMKRREHKITSPSNTSLTLRYDHPFGGVSLPLSHSKLYGFRAGLGLRLGPIVVGTSDLKWVFAPKRNRKIGDMDVHFALKLPILYSAPKDRDKDKVSDKLDACIETPGIWELGGCPDTDGDSIIDKKDDCPDVPGIEQFNGCPDTDGDSIIDKKDDCPDVPGIEQFNGCPDTDGDGLKDEDDLCPQSPGTKENKGCPDTDGDGVVDELDECPEEVGEKENKGCPWPDTDGDGLLDKDDKCPKNAGPAENDGCPYIDTDGDGVLDKDDECVNTPGLASNKGCPEVDEKTEEVLQTAFDNLEFESGRAVIAKTSYESLESLVEVLIKEPKWRLSITGHTDNIGNERGNLILSKKRSEAVKDFLVQKGIDENRFIIKYFGKQKPIATNDTKEGRRKNRRVEIEIVFD